MDRSCGLFVDTGASSGIPMGWKGQNIWIVHSSKMLTIKCSGCKQKLFKYHKIGPGQVLRCHKSRIGKQYGVQIREDMLLCVCGRVIGWDKGRYFSMDKNAFTYSGTKSNK